MLDKTLQPLKKITKTELAAILKGYNDLSTQIVQINNDRIALISGYDTVGSNWPIRAGYNTADNYKYALIQQYE